MPGAAAAQGATLAFTFRATLKKRVLLLAGEPVEAGDALRCERHRLVDAVFAELARQWGRLDFLVHAIAFSDKAELDGRYVDTTEKNFTQTMLISCYSFTALAQRAEKLMSPGGSLLTLTYYGAEKVMPHYNVMGVAKAALEACVRYPRPPGKGIRVNAISAGPIKTLAASGIADFRYIPAERTPRAQAHCHHRGGGRQAHLLDLSRASPARCTAMPGVTRGA